jgi:enterochelin esterase-like enzyme
LIRQSDLGTFVSKRDPGTYRTQHQIEHTTHQSNATVLPHGEHRVWSIVGTLIVLGVGLMLKHPVAYSLLAYSGPEAAVLNTQHMIALKSTTPTPVLNATASATPTELYICAETQGQVLSKTFYSSESRESVPYRVYLPPCYTQTHRRYPYMILLHGAGSDESEWTDELGVNNVLDSGIVEGTLPSMILVMPYGGELQWENRFDPSLSFESLIIKDFMPEVERNYCTWNAQEGRGLAGISRGGFWVFEIAFRHPDLFGILAGHSPYFDPTNAPPAFNPLDLANTVALSGTSRIWLDVGAEDADTLENLGTFAQTLTDRHFDLRYTVYPTGAHVAAYWQAHLSEYLAFYGKTWPLDPSQLPAC